MLRSLSNLRDSARDRAASAICAVIGHHPKFFDDFGPFKNLYICARCYVDLDMLPLSMNPIDVGWLNGWFYSAKTAVVAAIAAAFLFGLLFGGSFAASDQLDQTREQAREQAHAEAWNSALECLYHGGELHTEGCIR